MSKYEIKKSIPIPEKGPKYLYGLDLLLKMDIGDCYDIPCEHEPKTPPHRAMLHRISNYLSINIKNLDFGYTVKYIAESRVYRVWKTKKKKK